MDTKELAAWLRLALAPGVGKGTARRLLAAFGPPQSVLGQTALALQQVVGPQLASALLEEEPPELAAQLDATRQWLDGRDAAGVERRLATLGEPAYPAALLDMEDPPLMLFMLGRAGMEAPLADRSIAIVGSRNPTPQGALNAREFARALAGTGLCVVSGMALGVDGAAHEGALDGHAGWGPATIAVVGTGLDRVYPARHKALAHRIAQHGLIVSEFLLGTPPLNQNFPMRNRIIAGLSQGTLVVEAALKSGSLITARMAAEQGKEVFAIPGSIHSTQARGCHALIRQGAKLVESAQDVLEELRLPHAPRPADEAAPEDETLEHDAPATLLDHLGHDPVTLDALIARTGIDAQTLQAKLMELELEGEVARLPGALFQRRTSA